MQHLGWAQETPDLFSATVMTPFGGRGHVVVEALPGGGWDWAAWADGNLPNLNGEAETAAEAKRAAEAAARLLTRPVLIDARAQGFHLNTGRRQAN